MFRKKKWPPSTIFQIHSIISKVCRPCAYDTKGTAARFSFGVESDNSCFNQNNKSNFRVLGAKTRHRSPLLLCIRNMAAHLYTFYASWELGQLCKFDHLVETNK